MTATHDHTHNRANMYGLARHAHHYERWAGLFARPLYRRVAADVAAAGLPPAAKVLDIGTGPGTLPLLIAAQSPDLSVAGVDLSVEMIARVLRPGARAWIYDFRLTTRRAGRLISGVGAEIRVENPLTGTWPINPIGRLVLGHEKGSQAS